MGAPRLQQLSTTTTTDWAASELDFDHIGHEPLPFTTEEYAQRQLRIIERLEKLSVDAIITLRSSNVEYCTGFQSVETAVMPLILTPDFAVVVVPAAEVGRAMRSAALDEIAAISPFDDLLDGTLRMLGRRLRPKARVGIEPTAPHLSPAIEALGLRPVPIGSIVEHERLVLSEVEQQYARRAAASTARALPAVVRRIGTSVDDTIRDVDIAAAAQQALMLSSNSPCAVPVVVAAGARAGIPHSTWCGAAVESHRPVFMEYSGAWHRYHAPVMRTVCREEPADLRLAHLRRLAETTITAVEETLRPGLPAADVARAAERALGALEPWVVFHHNFGYPVGLAHPPSWLESPQWSLIETNQAPVREGTVYHVPAVFRAPGVGGIGHSQTYLVTATGCERLTPADPTVTTV